MQMTATATGRVQDLTIHSPGRPTEPDLHPLSPPVYEQGVRLPDPRPRPLAPPADWRDEPMPPGVAALPRDRRGYPIFVGIMPRAGAPADGKVDFRVLNVANHVRCIAERRCSICGERLYRDKYFLGGPMCVQNRVFGDAPTHAACARYAMHVCPFLVNSHRDYDLRETPGTIHDANVIKQKPERLVLYVTGDYALHAAPGGKPVIIVAPAKRVEWYTTEGVYLATTRPTRYAQ